MFKLDLEKAEEPEIKLQTSAGSLKKQENSRKTYFCFIDHAKVLIRKQQLEWTWNNRLVPNRKRSTTRLYIVTLLI